MRTCPNSLSSKVEQDAPKAWAHGTGSMSLYEYNRKLMKLGDPVNFAEQLLCCMHFKYRSTAE